MSEYIISHAVAIHVTAAADDVLSDANKVEGITKLGVTNTMAFEEKKHLNSDGYSKQEPVWNTLSGNFEGDKLKGSPTQAVISAAFEAKVPFYIHVVRDPTASAGSKGKRYRVFAETDSNDYEAGTSLKLSVPLKFDGAPVAF